MINPNITGNTLTAEEILLVRDCLVNSYLEALYLQNKRSDESENASNIQRYMLSLMFEYDYREITLVELTQLVREANSSYIYKWFFNRTRAALNMLPLDIPRLEKYIAKTMVFQTTSEAFNEYEAVERCSSSDWERMTNNHPIVAIILLWVSLQIPLHIEFLKGVEDDTTTAGS